MKIFALVLLVAAVAAVADETPRLIQHPHVYRVLHAPNDYVVFGRLTRATPEETTRYAYLRVTDGRMVERHETELAHQDNTGAVHYDINDQLTLFVPLTHVHRGQRRGPARLVSATEGREELKSIRPTESVLRELGVLDLIAARTTYHPSTEPITNGYVRQPSAGNNSAASVCFSVSKDAREKLEVLEAESKSENPTHFIYQQDMNDRIAVRMWTARAHAEDLAKRIRDLFNVEANVRVKLLEDIDLQHANPEGSVAERVAHLAQIVRGDDYEMIDLDQVHRGVAAAELWLKEIDEVMQRLHRFTHSAMALADLRNDFERPLLALIRQAFWRIHARRDQRGMIDMIYGWPKHYDFPLHYLNQNSGTKDGTYLESWLGTLRWRLAWGANADDDAFKKAERRATHDFSIQRRPLALAEVLPPHLNERFPSGPHFPLKPVLALGLPGGAKVRRELGKIILAADKWAELVRGRSGDEKIAGNALLAELLRAIALGMVHSGRELGHADSGLRFARYYVESATLFAELLQDARAIKNDATYLVLLDAAFVLMNEIEQDYDKNPAHNGFSNHTVELTGALLRLKDALIEELRPDETRTTRCARALEAQ